MSSNVISLSFHQAPKPDPIAALIHSFADQRRDRRDVYWLKENAEILNILECCGLQMSDEAHSSYAEFYASLPKQLAFFPQYYRFFLSMACDLEALGHSGDFANALCEFVHTNQLVRTELSDLQRAETMRLLARRGFEQPGAQALRDRLNGFIDFTEGFARPNRKTAYELTHIVFYLAEYGRRDPDLSASAVKSLKFTGILAFLEQNADLLSEVCVALSYAGVAAPRVWKDWVIASQSTFHIREGDYGASDHYHEYLVANWACAAMGGTAFSANYHANGTGFYRGFEAIGALGAVSEALLSLESSRSASWDIMEAQLTSVLANDVAEHLVTVAASTSDFAEFFEHFARVAAPKVSQSVIPQPARLERVTW